MIALDLTSLLTAATALCGTIGAVYLYVHYNCRDQARVIYKNTPFNEKVLSTCKAIHDDYCYPLWGSNKHFQTLYNSILRKARRPPYTREHYFVTDGGLIVLDWLLGPEDDSKSLFASQVNETFVTDTKNSTSSHSSPSSRPTLVICPGICNNSDSHYIRHFAATASAAGLRVVIYTPRGCAELATSLKLFTYGDTSDLREVVDYVAKKFPHSELVAVGFSLGANLLIKYVGEEGLATKENPKHTQKLKASVGVSLGFDGYEGIQYVKKTSPNLYYKGISHKLIKLLKRHENSFQDQMDVASILKNIRTIEDYDREFTCKVHGFNDIDSYYKDHSCVHLLKYIAIPTMFLNALDDPLIPPYIIPYKLPYENSNIFLTLTKYGGHLGWARTAEKLSSLFPDETHWHDIVVVEFLQSVLSVLTSE